MYSIHLMHDTHKTNSPWCFHLQIQHYAHTCVHSKFNSLWPCDITEYCWTWSLTHWGRDKMEAISQTTLSNPFSWMKIFEFWLKFHWSLFLRFQLTVFQHWFRSLMHICITQPQWVNGLLPIPFPVAIWTNDVAALSFLRTYVHDISIDNSNIFSQGVEF